MYNGKGVGPWSKEVEQASGGAVAIQIFVGPTLANFGNVYDRILSGVADMGFGLFGPLGREFAKTGVSQLPFEPATATEASVALWRLYEKGVIADEYAKVKPLSIATFPPTGFLSPKTLTNLDQLRGLKVSVGSRLVGQIAEIMGGSPVSMTTSDIYQSLQRGLVDASVIGWAATAAFKLHEVARYYVEAPMGLGGNFVLMNKDSFAKLPEAARTAIDRLSGERLARRMGGAGDEENAHGRKIVEGKPGHTITKVPEEEFARWRQRIAPLVDEWVKETPDGARVLAAYRAELQATRTAR
jgi:TRAP-type C4-dicarboxylate transport system substrate-binding protein